MLTKEERWLLEEKYGGEPNEQFEADRKRLAGGEPLAYVIGWVPFAGLRIYLDSKPLIPRPETEYWVGQLVSELRSGLSGHAYFSAEKLLALRPSPSETSLNPAAQFSILDLCAGSGAIGCALVKEFPNVQVSFGEIDPAREATIRKNLCENGLSELRADIRIGDLFAPFAGEQFDLIVANPPYIPNERILEASVADYEPALALRSGADGLDLIRKIAAQISGHLVSGGTAWIECDSAHAAAACALFIDQGFSCSVCADQYGAPRVLVVSSPHEPAA